LRAFFLSLVVSSLGLGILLVGDRGSGEWRRAQDESRSVRAQIEALQRENSALARRIQDAETSDFEVEKNARENLGLVKPDEVVFILPEPPTPQR
jgi:cell division protein FtsB